MKRFTGLFLALLTFAILTSNSSFASGSRSIAGQVLDERNRPAQNVYVSLIKVNENSEAIFQRTVSTNSEGKFEFADIEILSNDVVKIGAFKQLLSTDLGTMGNINSTDLEIGDIGAYANDVKGVIDNIAVNPSINFIDVNSASNNTNLVLRVSLATGSSVIGASIRPTPPPVNTGDIGTYPSPGTGGNKIKLYQNFPNPFNPQTKIVFFVSEQSMVNLKVYDMSGKEVMELVNENKAPGSYSVVFNGQNLSSGFYIYKLSAGSEMQINKMSLIK